MVVKVGTETKTEQINWKVKRWEAAKERLDEAQASVRRAETDIRNAINDLGKVAMPQNAKDGESITLFIETEDVADYLIITKEKQHDYKVSWRKRGL